MKVYEITATGLGINDAQETLQIVIFAHSWCEMFKQLSEIVEDAGTVMNDFSIEETGRRAFDYTFKKP